MNNQPLEDRDRTLARLWEQDTKLLKELRRLYEAGERDKKALRGLLRSYDPPASQEEE